MTVGRRVGYWAFALALTGFGVLALPSVGMPFLAVGVALVALAPFRDRPDVFRPWLAGVAAFFVGYVLVAPLACSAQETAVAPSTGGSPAIEVAGGDVACTNVLGLGYTGGPGYEPPLWPAALAGTATALGAAVVARLVVARYPDLSGPLPPPARSPADRGGGRRGRRR